MRVLSFLASGIILSFIGFSNVFAGTCGTFTKDDFNLSTWKINPGYLNKIGAYDAHPEYFLDYTPSANATLVTATFSFATFYNGNLKCLFLVLYHDHDYYNQFRSYHNLGAEDVSVILEAVVNAQVKKENLDKTVWQEENGGWVCRQSSEKCAW